MHTSTQVHPFINNILQPKVILINIHNNIYNTIYVLIIYIYFINNNNLSNSPWIGDYAWFMVGPQMGGMTNDPVGFWEPRGATIKPHYFDATTGPDGMRIGQL